MFDLEIDEYIKAYNDDVLHEQLMQLFGNRVTGCSRRGSAVRVHFVSEPTAQEISFARQLLSDHDADAETEQQKKSRERRQKLRDLKKDFDEALDLENPDLKLLARKVEYIQTILEDLSLI